MASLGGMLEFYDFTIYGFFSVYFANQFFPTHDKFIAILASYTIFVLGYIARPVGGIIFSHIGDEIGRKVVMIITMMIMGVASLGIASLPNYSQIGIFAPILLLFFRLIQGLAIGGEIPGTIVYIAEYMPQKSAYAIGTVMAGVGAGLLLGAFINVAISNSLSSSQIYTYGWRIPFIIGGLLCFVSYQVRKRLHETKVFTKAKNHSKFPLKHLIKSYPWLIVIGVGIGAIAGTSTMLILIFMPTYLVSVLNIDSVSTSNLLLFANAFMMIVTYITGVIANKHNHYTIMSICLLWTILITSTGYYLISNHLYVSVSVILLATLPGIFAALAPLLMSQLFPMEVRLTGVALSYNLGHTIFGGMAPIIIIWLINKFGSVAIAPIGYFLLVSLISLIATICAKKISTNRIKP